MVEMETSINEGYGSGYEYDVENEESSSNPGEEENDY